MRISLLVFFGLSLILFLTKGLKNLVYSLPLIFRRSGTFWFEAGPESIAGAELAPATQSLISELTRLGFVPLGTKAEKFPFRRTNSLDFASKERQTYASLIGYRGERPHCYFYTPFEDGSVVLTSDFPHDGAQADGFIHSGSSGATPDAVLADHRQRVESMTRPGRQPCRTYDQSARLRATAAYYDHPGSGLLTRRLQLQALANAASYFGMLAAATGLVIWKWLPLLMKGRN